MMIPAVAREQPLVLAPMDEITDQPFRRLARRFGADLVVTEFVSAEGIVHSAEKSLRKIELAPDEHPVGIQIFGSRVASVVTAALHAASAGPDLIDINFGCPARKVAGKGGGAGLLRDPELLEEMARAVVRAVRLPVTAKMRIGWDEGSINVLEIARRLEGAGIAALCIHARTRSQSYGQPADWSWIARVKEAVTIPVIGNGDVREPADAARMFRETGCDGVMIGRAALGNPWIFERARRVLDTGDAGPAPTLATRFAVLREHLRDAIRVKTERRAVIEMRKHYSGYLRGICGAARLRAELMHPESLAEVESILARHLAEFESLDKQGDEHAA